MTPPSSFCRDIEAYLCRKNDGHLVRVVGPGFVMVSGWEARGVPFKVACRGIDRCFERYYAKGPRRRPVQIEFCEADVLDAFDEWKRATGVGMAGDAGPGESSAPQKPAHSLRAHLDRVVTRLTDVVTAGGLPPGLEAAVERLIETLSREREGSRTLRGEAREACLQRLESLDQALIEAARESAAPEALGTLRAEAAEELAGYRARMPAEAYERALSAATDRLLRDRLRLPVVGYT